jgi:copper chaperone
MTTIAINIKGMTCGGCVVAVRNVLSRQAGLANVQVDVGVVKADVDDMSAREGSIRDAITRAGFEVSAISPAS